MSAVQEWQSLANQGDEWLLAYACIPAAAISASLFSIGHAVELYLKAAHVSTFGDISKAIAHGHRVRDLWSACRAEDSSFMSSYTFRDDIFDKDFLDSKIVLSMSPEDQIHYIKNQQFYLVFKHLQDLKYFGLPWKTRKPAPHAIAFLYPDPLWIKFFRDLRLCIGYPRQGDPDRIAQLLELNALPQAAEIYLRELYAEEPDADSRS